MIRYTNERIEREKDARRRITGAPITTKNGNKMWKICESLEEGDWIWVTGEGYDLPVQFVELHENGHSIRIKGGPYGEYVYYYQVLRKVTDRDREEIQEDVENFFGGYLVNSSVEMR
jgi:hypothetical protein